MLSTAHIAVPNSSEFWNDFLQNLISDLAEDSVSLWIFYPTNYEAQRRAARTSDGAINLEEQPTLSRQHDYLSNLISAVVPDAYNVNDMEGWPLELKAADTVWLQPIISERTGTALGFVAIESVGTLSQESKTSVERWARYAWTVFHSLRPLEALQQVQGKLSEAFVKRQAEVRADPNVLFQAIVDAVGYGFRCTTTALVIPGRNESLQPLYYFESDGSRHSVLVNPEIAASQLVADFQSRFPGDRYSRVRPLNLSSDRTGYLLLGRSSDAMPFGDTAEHGTESLAPYLRSQILFAEQFWLSNLLLNESQFQSLVTDKLGGIIAQSNALRHLTPTSERAMTTDQPRALVMLGSEPESRLAQVVCRHAGDNDVFTVDFEANAQRLEIFSQMWASVASSKNSRELIQNIVDLLSTAQSLGAVQLLIVDGENKTDDFVQAGVVHYEEWEDRMPIGVMRKSGSWGKLLLDYVVDNSSSHTLHIPDTENPTVPYEEWDVRVRSEYSIRVQNGTELFGIVTFSSLEINGFRSADVRRFLEEVANHVAFCYASFEAHQKARALERLESPEAREAMARTRLDEQSATVLKSIVEEMTGISDFSVSFWVPKYDLDGHLIEAVVDPDSSERLHFPRIFRNERSAIIDLFEQKKTADKKRSIYIPDTRTYEGRYRKGLDSTKCELVQLVRVRPNLDLAINIETPQRHSFSRVDRAVISAVSRSLADGLYLSYQKAGVIKRIASSAGMYFAQHNLTREVRYLLAARLVLESLATKEQVAERIMRLDNTAVEDAMSEMFEERLYSAKGYVRVGEVFRALQANNRRFVRIDDPGEALVEIGVHQNTLLDVLQEIVANAVEHEATECRIRASVSGGECTIFVTNNGRTPPPESLDRIGYDFSELFGIGSILLRGAVEGLGGTITYVLPDSGPGLTVELRFPIRDGLGGN